jgi:hypothetical protein
MSSKGHGPTLHRVMPQLRRCSASTCAMTSPPATVPKWTHRSDDALFRVALEPAADVEIDHLPRAIDTT